jgi:hypothetical protein
MIADCFRYYKGCDEYQRFGNIQLAPATMMHPIIKPWSFMVCLVGRLSLDETWRPRFGGCLACGQTGWDGQ